MIDRDQGTEFRPFPSRANAAYLLALLVVAILLAYVGRQVPTLLVGDIKSAFDLDDSQIGLLQGLALNLCFGLASLPVAMLIDRGNRVRLVWAMALVWAAATAVSGFTTEFWQLFACRMLVGLAEAGLVPATYSLIADLYAVEQRAKATLVYYAGSLIGASAGIALIGSSITWLGENAGVLPFGLGQLPVWRQTFIVAGAVCVPLLVLLVFAREPHRHGRETKSSAAESTARGLRSFLRDHGASVVKVILGITTMMVGVDALLTWTPSMLTRGYGIPPGRAGELLGLLWGVGSVSGVGAAWVLTWKYGARWGRSSGLYILRIGAAASAATTVGLLVVSTVDQFLLLITVYFFAVFIAAAIAPVVLSSLAPNHVRARVLALWVIASAIVSAISPAVVGVISDSLAAGPHDLRFAVSAVVIPCSVVGAALLAIGSGKRMAYFD